MGFIEKCIHSCWGCCKYSWLHKYHIALGILTLANFLFFMLSCSLSLGKGHRLIKWTFTRYVPELLLE
jgi:hypothetical protein